MVVGVGDGKEAQLVLLPVCERTMGLSRCTVAPRLQFTWKRGPLAPVVGEGQVNLVATGFSRLPLRLTALQEHPVVLLLMPCELPETTAGAKAGVTTGRLMIHHRNGSTTKLWRL